nr:hybrid signal transduction histidine kinase M [Tanacetum cinerariifolium]GEY32431.1 hybrid signal transduction histidine kinase M [Tanacetum cinerariifolium]
MVRSMLTTEEMRLKSRAQAISIDSTSSSPMVLLANSGNPTQLANVASYKVNKHCFNFNKGFCRFGEHCKFLHNGATWSASNTPLVAFHTGSQGLMYPVFGLLSPPGFPIQPAQPGLLLHAALEILPGHEAIYYSSCFSHQSVYVAPPPWTSKK